MSDKSLIKSSICDMMSCLVVFYESLWSSMLCDVSGHIVDRCWGLSKVKIRWGRWLPSWVVDGSCSNQLRTGPRC
jgi:hypothetical protein